MLLSGSNREQSYIYILVTCFLELDRDLSKSSLGNGKIRNMMVYHIQLSYVDSLEGSVCGERKYVERGDWSS